MKVSVPPRFGVSSALAGNAKASAAAKTSTPRNPTVICSSRRRCSDRRWPSFVEPETCQILIDEMRRCDLEPLQIRPVRHDAVPPQCPDLVRLLVEHIGLETAHQLALFCRIGLVQHLLIERDLRGVLVMTVIFGRHRGRQYLLYIERRVDDAPTRRLDDDIEIAVAHRIKPGARRQDLLRHVKTGLAP